MIKKKKKIFNYYFFEYDNKKKKTKKTFFSRQSFVVFVLYFLFFIIIAKLAYLQIFDYSNLNKYANNVVYKQSTEKQKRGAILDRNGNVLAMSVKRYTLYLDAKMIKDFKKTEEFLKKFNILLDSSHQKSIKQKKSYIPVKNNISEQIALEIEAAKIEGVGLEATYTRVYPERKLAAHIIGKVNSQENGTYGIEKFCNEQLIGENIKRNQYRIGGKKVFSDSLSDKDYDTSNDVKLTIDRKLQFIVEEELENGLKKTKSKKAVAIIQNPHNGEILAMASLPTYNPNEPVKDLNALKNGAISNAAEPGSTFKIVVLSAVLEEGLFKLSDKVNCENGKMKVAGQIIKDHDKQKIITVKQILEYSSNIGTAKLALKLGEEKFYKYIRMFGFNSMTGIELTGEEKGLLAPTDKWSKRSLHTISFGQEMFATPLQTISAFSTIANDGILLKPRIIKAIGEKQYDSPEMVRRVVSPDTAYKVRQALEGVIKNGTGKSARVPGYSVGGKTGTAQKFDMLIKKYSKKHYMASFCGMIPAMNPEIVILVIFDEPSGADYYASSVAAPVFAKIAGRTMEYLKIEPEQTSDKKGAKK